jgi:hypothetical protein
VNNLSQRRVGKSGLKSSLKTSRLPRYFWQYRDCYRASVCSITQQHVGLLCSGGGSDGDGNVSGGGAGGGRRGKESPAGFREREKRGRVLG